MSACAADRQADRSRRWRFRLTFQLVARAEEGAKRDTGADASGIGRMVLIVGGL